ncbi:MAG: hypothetical protein IT559_06145 [Alphaproteobacteria bacterium]|nr:hypothetical protein [Alphaproteobacteria bacterium]
MTPIFLILFLFAQPDFAQAQAQERAAIRTGIHGEYSRLVFDWPKSVKYRLERPEPGTLVLHFEADSALDTSGFKSVPNVTGLRIVSEKPLSVSLSIPEKSRTRDMAAGSRIILDVYNPPEEAPASAPPPKKTAEKSAPAKDSVEKPVAKEATAEKTPDQSQAESASVPPPAAKEPEKPAPAETIKIKPSEQPTMVVLSSTQNFGLAVFELAGRLFIANDKSDLLTAPQISGPAAATIGQPETVPAEQGKVYAFKIPPAFKLMGQGKGPVWRVMMSPSMDEKDGAEPVRKEVKPEEAHSGALLIPLTGAQSVLDIVDEHSGRTIKAVTVTNAAAFSGRPRDFVEFSLLRAPIGLAVVPKVDDLKVEIVPEGVVISRPSGLTLVEEAMVHPPARLTGPSSSSAPRLFDFKGWQLGGLPALAENKSIILGGLNNEGAKIEGLLTLAKMYLSNAMGPEALGILRFAAQEMPALEDSPEFVALVGVADALSQHLEKAFSTLSREDLQLFVETGYWRAYTLAGLGDWQQAAAVLPDDVALLNDYPDVIVGRLGPALAEVALRAGNVELGTKILERVEAGRKALETPQLAALDYLKGELARQKGKLEEAKKLWKTLASGPDRLYRVRAGLALTRLGGERDAAANKKVIDALERLRYAWRGDELEAQVNYWLGRAYFESGDYIKGLKIMRDATTFAPGTDLAKRIAGDMVDLFTGLFLGGDFEKMSPLNAVTLYDQFSELVPLGDNGNQVVDRLAEYLVQAGLLERAGDLLAYQIEHRLTGEQSYKAAMRLAAIRLLDNQPAKALSILNLAAQKLETLPEELRTPKNYSDVALLKARALSRQGHPDKALALLGDMEQTPDVNRLRADIAWTASYWDDAAEALEDVISDRDLSLTRPLRTEDVDLLMRRGIALNLGGNRIELANMRQKYTDLMNQTEKGKVFEVITRPRQSSALADRETLLGIVSEVDLFADFLNSYKTNSATPPTPKASEPAAATAPSPGAAERAQ